MGCHAQCHGSVRNCKWKKNCVPAFQVEAGNCRWRRGRELGAQGGKSSDGAHQCRQQLCRHLAARSLNQVSDATREWHLLKTFRVGAIANGRCLCVI